MTTRKDRRCRRIREFAGARMHMHAADVQVMSCEWCATTMLYALLRLFRHATAAPQRPGTRTRAYWHCHWHWQRVVVVVLGLLAAGCHLPSATPYNLPHPPSMPSYASSSTTREAPRSARSAFGRGGAF